MNKQVIKNSIAKQSCPKRIAMYVIYDPAGILDGYRKYYLQELRNVTDYICVIVSGTLTSDSRKQLEYLVDDIFVRENKGLLAGSWVAGIQHIGWDVIDKYDELLMLNDSFFGPFYPLQDMFEKMEESKADFYGAFKNYEEKSYKEIAGRKLKHGYFRGSICYFYIIKKRLLHSSEFKKYWSTMPEIKENWDTYFFAEMDFYDYVLDCGFLIDAYQDDSLKGYFFDNLSHNMHKLIADGKIPFARIRPFGTDMKSESLQVNYGKDPRETLAYITEHTQYDENLIWDYLLRTKNLTHIYNQLQLEYVIPRDTLEKEFLYKKKVAVILHIYYKDLVEKIADYCLNFIANTDFFITTTQEDTKKKIVEAFKKRNLTFQCKIRPNVGVAMSSLWVTYVDVVLNDEYEYICYFHDKKSPYGHFSIWGEQFAKRCYENLFGTSQVVMNIINLFEKHPRLGVLGAPLVYHGPYFDVAHRSWRGNYENVKKLSNILDLNVDINCNINPVAPYGDMFWFRTKALKKALGKKLDYDFFDIKYKQDFTILHAIERSYGFIAQDSGYYYAEVINSDEARSDLINYQYILYSLCQIMMDNGHEPCNFETMKEILRCYKGKNMSFKFLVKKKVKKFMPESMWNLCKKVYRTIKPLP